MRSCAQPKRFEESTIPTDAELRILFLTRRYPPAVGGIETHCFELYTRLKDRCNVRLVALGRQSLLHLAWFIPYIFLTTLWALLHRRVDVVYFSDGVVCSLAPLLRPFSRARFVVTIYGLEMTYSNPIARNLMRWGARCCERVAVISQVTADITASSGVDPSRLDIIYVGIEPKLLPDAELLPLRQRFEETLGLRFGEDRIILNFGRQVRRKGLAAFLEQGMPLLEPDITLIIGGRGPEVPRLERLRSGLGLEDRVHILGHVDDGEASMLRQSADLFLFPNIQVAGDVEGFGMTQLEAMYAGTPVVAFAVDALVESVREGGYLVEAEDYQGYVDHIHGFYSLTEEQREAKRAEARDYVRRVYSWDETAHHYAEIFAGD